jgi:hypothetical protein
MLALVPRLSAPLDELRKVQRKIRFAAKTKRDACDA